MLLLRPRNKSGGLVGLASGGGHLARGVGRVRVVRRIGDVTVCQFRVGTAAPITVSAKKKKENPIFSYSVFLAICDFTEKSHGACFKINFAILKYLRILRHDGAAGSNALSPEKKKICKINFHDFEKSKNNVNDY